HVAISAGQIPAPDAAREEHIAAEKNALLFLQKAKTAGAMTRNKQDLQIVLRDRKGRRFVDEKIGFERLDFELETEPAEKFRVVQHRSYVAVKTDSAAMLA